MYQEQSAINAQVTSAYREYSQQKLGRVDQLVIPETVETIEKQWGYLFLPKDSQKIDTLVIFVHSGIRVPDGFDNLLNVGTPEAVANLAEAIILNVDLGGSLVASRVLQQLAEHPTAAVVWYDYTRVVGDPNRVALDEQVPNRAFRGESPWSSEAPDALARKPLVDATVQLFFADLLTLLKDYQPKVVISPHTYDPVGGGIVSSSIIDTLGNSLRPAGVIFQENTFVPELGTLLTPEEAAKMQEIYLKTLQRISTLQGAGNIAVPLDEPYKIGFTLVVWMQMLHESAHFMYEMRKDMFENITEGDIDLLAQLIFTAQSELIR